MNPRELGSLSAGNKENRVFTCFAYLCKSEGFVLSFPTLMNRAGVSTNKTVLNYLELIQKAQMTTKAYRNRLESGYLFKAYGMSKVPNEAEIGRILSTESQSRLEQVRNLPREELKQLDQFVFPTDLKVNVEELYDRLEKMMLIGLFTTRNKGLICK